MELMIINPTKYLKHLLRFDVCPFKEIGRSGVKFERKGKSLRQVATVENFWSCKCGEKIDIYDFPAHACTLREKKTVPTVFK